MSVNSVFSASNMASYLHHAHECNPDICDVLIDPLSEGSALLFVIKIHTPNCTFDHMFPEALDRFHARGIHPVLSVLIRDDTSREAYPVLRVPVQEMFAMVQRHNQQYY
jgi:hypothetical protein